MRRRTEAEGAQQMTKLRFSIVRFDTERLEHFVLQFRLVDSHAAAANLNAVQNHVISLSANFGKFFFFKQQHVLGFRPGEWMMHRVPFVFIRTPFEERKIYDPEEIPDFAGRHELLHFRDAQA